MLAFGFGNPGEWAIIFIVALIVFGPKKLPEIGQQIGQALREFRKVADDVTGVTDSIRSEVAGATQSFRRQVDEVRDAASFNPQPIVRNDRSIETPAAEHKLPDESNAMEPAVPEAGQARGLRISTALPTGLLDRSDVKGQE